MARAEKSVLKTPDGRYIVVRGRLWRTSDPNLSEPDRQAIVNRLMDARRAVRDALKAEDDAALKQARAAVQAAKVDLGERGPVWWSDDAPDYTRYLAKNTPYASWYSTLASACDPEITDN
ncbi:MAG: hypothetical protein WA908_00775 [Pontixanthobacter sp.]